MKKIYLLIATLLCFSIPAFAEPYCGQVSSVSLGEHLDAAGRVSSNSIEVNLRATKGKAVRYVISTLQRNGSSCVTDKLGLLQFAMLHKLRVCLDLVNSGESCEDSVVTVYRKP